jgi:hypothetical protein
MKKYYILFLAIIGVFSFTWSHKERYSQTFMATRPINQAIATAQAAWHTMLCTLLDTGGTAFQLYSIYQKSINESYINRYFLPLKCKNEIVVAGDNTQEAASRDIRAEWLGITNDTFQGKFTLRPAQKQCGIFFECAKNLEKFIAWDFFKDSWISINIPLMFVQNNIRIAQYDIVNNTQLAPESMDIIEALSRKELKFSRIYPGNRHHIGFAEINAKLGRAYLAHNNFEIFYYSGLRIPVSGSQNAQFLFNPYVGNNKHLGFQTGVQFQIKLTYDWQQPIICFFACLESTFFTHNEQFRTFDLKKKPWSRYLLLNKKDGPADQNIPATKILTLNTRVKPYNTVELSTGWRIKTTHIEGEVGYELWAHGDEHLKLKCHFEEVYGIAGTGKTTEGSARSASKSTISQQAENDTIIQKTCENNQIICTNRDHFVVISKNDINKKSAAARAAINHKFHAAISYISHTKHIENFVTVAGFYEYPQKNTALKCCGVWIKMGITF